MSKWFNCPKLMSIRFLRTLLAGLLTFILVLSVPRGLTLAASVDTGVPIENVSSEIPALAASAIIPISEQPFYPFLLESYRRWATSPLSSVVGDSPRDTLLNFYAVMTHLTNTTDSIISISENHPGLFWGSTARINIQKAEGLFALATHALDSSSFPESIREDMSQESALELKEVLDYVFTHSQFPIDIPDQIGLKALNAQRTNSIDSWTLPHTLIILENIVSTSGDVPGFLFSASTVSNINRMYNLIRDLPRVDQPFASPGLYSSFTSTPGFIVPPLWYLKLPPGIRNLLEISFFDQTVLQISASLFVLLAYIVTLSFLFRRFLHTFGYSQPKEALPGFPLLAWFSFNKAWYRVIIIFPLLPLSLLSTVVIDNYINFTGTPLLLVEYILSICFYISLSILIFLSFDALGCTVSARLVQWRGGSSELQLQRVSNLIVPVFRVLGASASMFTIYRLLVVLGLPSTTVLAFSAVPGLAIGLGASKLLGNLFGGLSIQTDRPVRVGEFCQIGNTLGFVTKIGMRSLVLQTLDSRVTIPNSIVDEQTIVNFSRRDANSDECPTQSLVVRVAVTRRFNSDQVADLLFFARLALADIKGVHEPLVSIEEEQSEGCTILCHALVAVHSWDDYIVARERILLRLEEVVEQVHLSQRSIGVSYDTSSDQLECIPDLIRDLVETDPLLKLKSCRLMTIAAFSYEFNFRFHAHHGSLSAIKDSIDRLNHDLLASFADQGIEIPYPTAVEIRKLA